MAKSNTRRKSNTTRVVEVKAEKVVSDNVLLQLQLATVYKAVGQITGKQYTWAGAGSVLPVDRNDAEVLLVKAVRRGCCGAGSQNKPVFVEV